MTHMDRPRFSELPPADAVAILERNQFGRLAFSFHDRIDIEPLSFVFADQFIYFRTSPGTKVTALLHHPWVAFEVDEIEGLFDWRSVVVHGTLYPVDPEGGDRERDVYSRAIGLLRKLDAAALTSGDPAPARTSIFRVYADTITGRAATTAR